MNSRRSFLQKAGATAIVLSTPAISVFSSPISEIFDQDKILRVAIMGLGSYGTRVAEAMQDCKRAKLVGVISGTPSNIAMWQSKYGIPAKNCYNYENFDAIKDNPDIDAVYVITPNALHKGQVILLMQLKWFLLVIRLE